MKNNGKIRIEALDYLRGAMALSVMLYHYSAWTLGLHDGNTVLGRLGIYAVSIFYILSGISLYIAYKGTELKTITLADFWKKRFLRLAPLFWIACIGTFIFQPGNKEYSIATIVKNFTLLFGVTDYTNYIPVGGWSIGNEFAFYILFPVLLVSASRALVFYALIAISFAVYYHYAFNIIDPSKGAGANWKHYIHPANQFFLFAAGVWVARAWDAGWLRFKNPTCIAMLSVSMAVLLSAFNTKDPALLMSGVNRLVFTACAIIACASCLSIKSDGSTAVEKILKQLGDTSYSIYMLHPVIINALLFLTYKGFVKQYVSVPVFAFAIAAPATIVISYLTYRYVEKPFIRMGKSHSGTIQEKLKSAFR